MSSLLQWVYNCSKSSKNSTPVICVVVLKAVVMVCTCDEVWSECSCREKGEWEYKEWGEEEIGMRREELSREGK